MAIGAAIGVSQLQELTNDPESPRAAGKEELVPYVIIGWLC